MVVNKKFWDGLPGDVRSGLEKAMAEATEFANDIAEQENKDSLEAMKKSGKTEFHEMTDAERKAWVKALAPVHKEMAGRVGKDILERIYAATGDKF